MELWLPSGVLCVERQQYADVLCSVLPSIGTVVRIPTLWLQSSSRGWDGCTMATADTSLLPLLLRGLLRTLLPGVLQELLLPVPTKQTPKLKTKKSLMHQPRPHQLVSLSLRCFCLLEKANLVSLKSKNINLALC